MLYLFCLVAIVATFFIIKKITGCLIKTIILLAVIGALGYIFFNYIR